MSSPRHGTSARLLARRWIEPVTGYYVFNSVFNLARATASSTYALVVLGILGLPASAILVLLIADLLVSTVLEVPTGVLADVRGRKWSFLIAIVLCGVGYAAYGSLVVLPASVPFRLTVALLGEAAIAAGIAFYSTSLDAWIVDHPDRNPALPLQKLFARGHALKNAGYLGGGILGVAIHFSRYSERAPTFFLPALICLLLLGLASRAMNPDTRPPRPGSGQPTSSTSPILTRVRRAGARILADPRLKALTIGSTTSLLLLQVIVTYWPVYLKQLVGGTTPDTLSLAGFLVLSWVLAYGCRALGNAVAGAPSARKRPFRALVATAALTGLGAMALVLVIAAKPAAPSVAVTIAAILLYCLTRLSEGAGESLRTAYSHACITEDRATLTSVMTGFALAVSSAVLLLALLVENTDSIVVLWGGAALFQIASIAAYFTARKPLLSHEPAL